jgi:HD superfamily phosphohydrolase YqeK
MHRLIEDAAEGRLPDWAVATPSRRDHMARVAGLMVAWGKAWGLDAELLNDWRAAAMLHDALRDADPESLRPGLGPPFRDLPGGLLHGPAVAARLEKAGVWNQPVVNAVRWHTLGHPELDRLGHALYMADYTEPGRDDPDGRLAELRERAPDDPDSVIRAVAADRIRISLRKAKPLREPTVAFWNSLLERDGGG